MGKDKMKASWDINTTKLFIDLCLEQVTKGRRKNTSFTRNGWDDIGENFTKRTGRVYAKSQFKNKHDSLRKDWSAWHKLLRETGVGWDNERNTVAASEEWWEKKISENSTYEKFRYRGLQFHGELAELFENVAASGVDQWAPSSMTLPTPIEPVPENDTQEGSGDSDDVVGDTTGVSAEFNSVTFNGINTGSGGNNQREPGTSAAAKSTSGNMTTSSLGVRRRGDTMKKKGPSSAKIADALSMLVEETRVDRKREEARADRMAEEARANRMAEEARADRMAAEARAERMAAEERAYEISIAGVMHHLKQVPEVVCDHDFYARCTHLLMTCPPAREVYAAVKDMREQLLVFLRHECYKM